MKEVVEYLCDSFVDFEGKEHKFVLCALSQVKEDVEVYDGETGAYYESARVLTIGCSVCNLNDDYDEALGKKIAYNRAKSEKYIPTLVSTLPGVINTSLVQALLRQEADYIKRDPNCVIPGYNEKAFKLQAKKSAEALYKNMTAEEQLIVEAMKNGFDLNYYAGIAKELGY